MATNKKETKKQAPKEKKDVVVEKLHESLDEAMKLIKQAKDSFKNADSKTKRKIIASVAGVVTLLGGVIGIKAIKKKMKK